MDDSQELDRLTAQLQMLHARIESYSTTRGGWWPTKAEEWVADVWRYDKALVSAAELFGIPVPPRPPQDANRRLSPAERVDLERLLAAQGIDVAQVPVAAAESQPDAAGHA